MRDAFVQSLLGVGGVFAIFAVAAVFNVVVGHDAPLGEAAIGGVVAISIARSSGATYTAVKNPPSIPPPVPVAPP